jgi:hypothetical protein
VRPPTTGFTRSRALVWAIASLALFWVSCHIGDWAERLAAGQLVPRNPVSVLGRAFRRKRSRAVPAFRSLLPERRPQDAPPGTVTVKGRGRKIETVETK